MSEAWGCQSSRSPRSPILGRNKQKLPSWCGGQRGWGSPSEPAASGGREGHTALPRANEPRRWEMRGQEDEAASCSQEGTCSWCGLVWHGGKAWLGRRGQKSTARGPSPTSCKHGQLQPLKQVKGHNSIQICVQSLEKSEHGLQPHQAAHEVVEVHGQVGLRVAGDDELKQLLVELEACRLDGHPHLVGAHAA